MNFVDPDGNKLYFAAEVSEAFKQKFAAVVQFMNEKGTAGDLATLEASDKVYYINEVALASENNFSPKQMTISWAPDAIAVTKDHMHLSPATTLAHEAAHAAAYDKVISTDNDDDDRELNQMKTPNSDPQFDTLHERSIVAGPEQIAARKHGEIREDQITRKNKYLRPQLNVPKGYTPEQVSKAVFEHNNSF